MLATNTPMDYRYNVGDRVQIVSLNTRGAEIVHVTPSMRCKGGHIYKVRARKYDVTNKINVYWLGDSCCAWAEDMLWPVEEVSLLDIIQKGEANG